MEIEERATGRLDTADLEKMVEEAMVVKGYKVVSGLKNSALTGINLELELVRLTLDEKEVARRAKISQATKGGGQSDKSNKKQQKVVAAPDEHPL